MSLKLKIGKNTVQGYGKVLSNANMTDCYSFGQSALIALEFLRLNKSFKTGGEMGFCISALRQVLFAKIKRDPSRSDRLPLGTLFWGVHSELDPSIKSHPDFETLLGDLIKLIKIWPDHIRKG